MRFQVTARALSRALALIALSILLAACGSGSDSTPPKLAALPTRTPAPVTPTPTAGSVQPVRVLSMGDAFAHFLDRAGTLNPLDQKIDFISQMQTENGDCFSAQRSGGADYPLITTLTTIALPVMDQTAWRDAIAALPDTALAEQVVALFGQWSAEMPLPRPVTACLLPIPQMDRPAETDRFNTDVLPLPLAFDPLNVILAKGDLMWITCSAGPACLDQLEPELARGYALAYQYQKQGVTISSADVLTRVIDEGRASVYARTVDPAASFRWDAGLSAEDEFMIRRQLYYASQGTPFYGASNDMIVFGRMDRVAFPPWGGLIVGEKIVNLYLEQYPGLVWTELAALPATLIVEASGYDLTARE